MKVLNISTQNKTLGLFKMNKKTKLTKNSLSLGAFFTQL